MIIEYIVEENTIIKEFIFKNISRNFYGFLKENNAIYYVNGNVKKSYEPLLPGDVFKIEYIEKRIINNNYLSDGKLDILYEDEYYIVVNKEAHLQTIPSKRNPFDSVYNRLLTYFKDTNNNICIVNRLDKETQGLILICKNNYSRAILKDIDKTYYAKTNIKLDIEKGVINLPIEKVDGIKRGVSKNGDRAITNFEYLNEENGIYTYKIKLETGRTHQIRVHFSYLGSPLINDTLYGGILTDGILGLVCCEIRFIHPITKEVVNICL